jgi:hypothetical protein
MLLVKHDFSGGSNFFHDGRHVADYDGGSCELYFNDGKFYSLSLWSSDLIENGVYPTGTAKIACIEDFHCEVVADEESADLIRIPDYGETTYFKEGEVEVVAHSETPIVDNSEWAIVCNKKQYKATCTRKLFGFQIIELYEDDARIASIYLRWFSAQSHFECELPLPEQVFITLLAFNWWDD